MIFDEETAPTYNHRPDTPQGRYLDVREKELILNMTSPRPGEVFLEVGCGAGDRLLLFRNKGCDVTGIEPSAALLEQARRKLGERAGLDPGNYEELPFSDNEFDIVSLMMPPHFAGDPEKAIGEAIRVSRGRVFIGVINSHSFVAVQRKFQKLYENYHHRSARYFHVYELMGMIRRFLPDAHMQWGSVIFLPAGWYGFAVKLEESLPVMRNPFGAFLGISFPVTFNLRTVQNIIGDPFKIKAKGVQPIQGAVRESRK
jgi:ubiquinone/menaquinone biosynthesis C-methylase UbiE